MMGQRFVESRQLFVLRAEADALSMGAMSQASSISGLLSGGNHGSA